MLFFVTFGRKKVQKFVRITKQHIIIVPATKLDNQLGG